MPDPAETEARAQLAAMAPRLGDAPHALLGVPADASREVLRAAFLRLTKQYHPTKYARFAPDVVRLANEVFLTIKRAYDQLQAPAKVAAPAAGSSPPARPAAATARPPVAAPRAPTVPGTSSPRAPTAPISAPPRATPATGIPKISFNPPTSPPKPTAKVDFNPPTAPPRPTSQPLPARAPTPIEQAMEPAMELMRRKLWAEARQALLKLAVAQPQEKKFRAYMHYARGRESQEAGKLDEARAEWQRALGLDPDATQARRALEDLPPEPQGGGLLGRLFGKK